MSASLKRRLDKLEAAVEVKQVPMPCSIPDYPEELRPRHMASKVNTLMGDELVRQAINHLYKYRKAKKPKSIDMAIWYLQQIASEGASA